MEIVGTFIKLRAVQFDTVLLWSEKLIQLPFEGYRTYRPFPGRED